MALITHKHSVRALVLTLLLSGVFAFKVSAQTTTTSTATVWSSTSSWSTALVPGATSTANITYPITIDQGVAISSGTYSFSANATDAPGGNAYSLNATGGTLTVNSGSIVTFEGASSMNNVTLTIKSGGTLILGALTIGNNTKITIEAGGTLIVNGNVTDSNNGTGFMDIQGYMQVNGNYLAPAGGVSIVGTSGVFQTTGSMITSGGSTVFGSANDCTTGPCSGSSLTCGFRNQISPANQTICSGQTATIISSSNDVPAGTTVTYQWQWSASQGSGFTDISNASSASLDPANSGDAVVNSRIVSRLNTYFRVKLVVNGCPTTPENYSPSSAIIFTSLTPPSVSLTSTSFSACAGTASSVNIAYSVASGTVSTYSLSWSPTTGNLPAVTSASTSGSPISFTVPATAVTGTYTGTLTFYDANSCTPGTKTITLSVGSSIPVLAALSPITVCETGASQTASLSYSATNTPVTYSIVWNTAGTNAGFAAVTNASISASPLSIALPATAVAGAAYTGTLTVSNGCGTSAGQSFNITLLSRPSITLGASPAVCRGATSTSLSYSATSGSPTSYSISWDATALAAGFTAVSNTALPASPISITVPATAAASTYNATLTVTNANTCVSTSNAFTVTINALPTITLGTSPSVCRGTTSASLPYSATSGTPTTYSISWSTAAQTAGFVTVSNAALSSSPISITVPAAAAAATYSGTLTVRNGNSCVSTSSAFTVRVNALPAITLGTSPSVCRGTTSASLPYSAASGSPTTYSISWSAAAQTAGFVAVSNIALPTSPISITVPGAAAAATYSGTLTVRNGNSCVSTSNAFTVTVNALPTITLGTSPSVCRGTTSASLPYSATSGSPTTYSISWNAAALTAGFVAVSNTALPSSPISITVPAAAAAATYSGTLTVRNGNSCVSTSNAFTVTVNALPAITLGTSPAVCSGSTSASLPFSSTSGSPTTYSINWDATALAQGFAAVSATALASSPISITVPAGAATAIYNGTVTVSNANNCVSTSTAFTVTVNGLPTIALGTSPIICSGTTSALLPYSATTGSPTTYSVTWDATASGEGFAAVSNATLSTSPISITVPAAAAPATYNGTLVVGNGDGCVSTGNPFTITVNGLPTITLGTSPGVCSGTTSASLGYSTTSGSPVTYSINWDATAGGAGFVTVLDDVLPSSPISISIPVDAPAATYNGTLTVSNANNCVSTSNAFTVTVNPLPSVTLGLSPGVCSGESLASLSYSATSGSPTTCSIDWDALALGAGFTSLTDIALPSTPISISVPVGAAASTYNGTLIVKNGNSCVSTTTAFTVTVNALPTIMLGTASGVCSSTSAQISTLTYSATTGSPVNYSITWNAAALGQNFANIVDANLPASIGLSIPANAVAGTYSGDLTVINAGSCVSSSTTFSVIIADSGTLTWTGNVNNDWLNTGNWTCNTTPTSSNHVLIPSSLTNYPVITGSASCNDLTISSGASLALTNASILTLNGHFTNNGVFSTNQGVVAFTGSTSQNVNNNGASFYTIQVNKSGGSLSLFQTLPLLHLLDIQTATAVNSNGNLVLISTDSTTANDAAIGPIPSGASVNGNVTVNRYISNEGNINRYIAAPVKGVTSAMFSDDMTMKSGATIRSYNEPVAGAITNGYVYWSGSGSLTSGRGYLAYMYDKKRVHLDLTGTIHKGEFDYTATVGKVVSYTTTTGGPSADGWNLIGNPYPSAITWGTTGWTRDQGGASYVDGTISVPDLSITTGYPNYYHSYNYADGTGDLPGGIIAMGQAFWVHVTSAAAVLKVDESAKTSAANGRFYRKSTGTSSQFLMISLSNGKLTDNSFFKTNESATDGFDIYDGYKFKNPTINCFLVDKDNEHLVMHTLNEIQETDKIFIGIEVAEAGTYTLNISNTENFSNAGDLFFVDKSEAIVIPLNEMSDYRFSTAGGKGAVTDRFFITRDKNEIHKYDDGFAAYPNPVDDILNIRGNSTMEIATAQLINQHGEVVMVYRWKGLGQINMSQFGRGMFILKIMTADRMVIKKIVRP
jgi:hypothetical protein